MWSSLGKDRKEKKELRRSKDGVGLRACQILREPLKSHGRTICFFVQKSEIADPDQQSVLCTCLPACRLHMTGTRLFSKQEFQEKCLPLHCTCLSLTSVCRTLLPLGPATPATQAMRLLNKVVRRSYPSTNRGARRPTRIYHGHPDGPSQSSRDHLFAERSIFR